MSAMGGKAEGDGGGEKNVMLEVCILSSGIMATGVGFVQFSVKAKLRMCCSFTSWRRETFRLLGRYGPFLAHPFMHVSQIHHSGVVLTA